MDARLPDGSRINAIIPPVSLTGPCLTIRKSRGIPYTLEELVRTGSLAPEASEYLRDAVLHRLQGSPIRQTQLGRAVCTGQNPFAGTDRSRHVGRNPLAFAQDLHVPACRSDPRLQSVTSCSRFEPSRSVVRVNDITQIPARDEAGHRQVFHHYLPDRRSQTRGVTAFAPMADTADHWDDLQFANLVTAKIQSCYTILREMDAGAPTLPFADGRDHGETTEIRPDGEARTLTDAVPAFEICGYKARR